MRNHSVIVQKYGGVCLETPAKIRVVARGRAGATSIVGKGLLPAITPKSPLLGRAMGVLQIARRCNNAADLPDASKCFRGRARPMPAGCRSRPDATSRGGRGAVRKFLTFQVIDPFAPPT